jgi:hypothetical protein
MTSLLRAACREADAAGYEFCWLGGDRVRYGRFGWATGGLKMCFNFHERYLPDPPPEARVRPLDPERDLEIVREYLADEPDTVVVEAGELNAILRCGTTGGWVLGDAFIAHRRGGHNVYLGSGTPEEIASLLSHHLRWSKAQPEGSRGVTVECAAAPSALMRTCQGHYASMSIVPSGMFRVGRLKSCLDKACQVAQARVTCGSGRVSLTNSESGETVTVMCRNGRLSAEEGGREDTYSLDRRELSEVCFGLCPLELHLPGLPEDSFLRRVLPLRAHWSRFFGV